MNLVTLSTARGQAEVAASPLPGVRALLESLCQLMPPDVALALVWRDANDAIHSEAVGPPRDDALRCALAMLEGQVTPEGCICQCLEGEETPYVLAATPGGRVPALPAHMMQLVDTAIRSTLASAVTRSRMEELTESHRVQRALFRISELSQSGMDLPTLFARIHEEVSSLMYAENFLIALWDRNSDTVSMPYFVDTVDPDVPDAREVPIDSLWNSLTVQMMRRGAPMMGPSRELCHECGITDAHILGPSSRMWMGVPMLKDGRVSGAVVVQSYDHAPRYTRQSLDLLSYVAQHLQIVLERRYAKAQLEEEVDARTSELRETNWALQLEIEERERAERLQAALFRISELSASQGDSAEFFAQVHGILGGLIDCSNFFIALIADDDPAYLDFVYAVDERDTIPARWPRSRGVPDYVINTGRPVLLDVAGMQRLKDQGEITLRGEMCVSWLGVPLMRNGSATGVMVVQSYRDDVRFNQQDMELLGFAAQHIVSTLERRGLLRELEGRVRDRTQELAQTNRTLLAEIGERIRAEQRLQYQANHDSLTGLPNRQQLLERLQLNMLSMPDREGAPGFAVLYLDMDQFKLVNDSMGHAAGDEMLVEVAKRLRAQLGPHDLVARLGGDEFAILAELVASVEDVNALAGRILSAFEQPLYVHDRELFPSASIGIALWQPSYTSGEEMLRDADAAMYRAKATGRSQAMLFDEAMRAESLRLLDLEADLRRAINADAFEVHLQPVVHLGNGRVVGHEALVRWRHESHGLQTPAAFIGVGEDSGLIREVDWLVYRKVAAWLGSAKPRGYVSVNVSPLHFRSPEFANKLLQMLDEAGADPGKLRIEITEASLLEDTGRTLELLNQLKARGVLAMLDDFGTGFSALSYLRRFPFHALKIDRSFVAGLHDSSREESGALVKAIVALADGLGMDCIAEGVETAQQRDYLREEGCTYGQGYLFAPPRGLAEFKR